MLQWDLSNTPLAQSDIEAAAPNDGELLALMVGLMMVSQASYSDLRNRCLMLTEENRNRVAAVIEARLPELTRDIGVGEGLRRRLVELTGIRVSRNCLA